MSVSYFFNMKRKGRNSAVSKEKKSHMEVDNISVSIFNLLC